MRTYGEAKSLSMFVMDVDSNVGYTHAREKNISIIFLGIFSSTLVYYRLLEED